MIQKKICMLGATGVGKTSLVQRYVRSIFSEKYHQTIGVKIDKTHTLVGGRDVTLLLWDLQGEDGDFQIRPSFLRGASGFLLVVDLTRHETLVTAFSLQKMVAREIGDVPFVALFNKNDLTENFEITENEIEMLGAEHDWKAVRTSAKTGEAVERAFQTLAEMMLAAD
jgi:small GTP-binding protein